MNEFFRTEKVRTAPAATHSATHSNALVENPFEEIAVQPEPAATER
ncbi:streptamidine family RiPP [Modestobacter sp. Leaf380]|nr:streptamidine family RiPP [Modestobacter sp. Leaf380]